MNNLFEVKKEVINDFRLVIFGGDIYLWIAHFLKQREKFLKYNYPLLVWKQMKDTKNQKLQNSQYLERKGKLQNFGLNQTKKAKRFFFRKEKEGFVVFDSLASDIFFVNKTSKEILLLIDRNLDKNPIIDIIAKKYKISKNKSTKAVNLIWRKFK